MNARDIQPGDQFVTDRLVYTVIDGPWPEGIQTDERTGETGPAVSFLVRFELDGGTGRRQFLADDNVELVRP